METATRTKYHSLLFEIKHINMLRSICARSNTDTMFNKINARVQNSVVGNCFFATQYIVYYTRRALPFEQYSKPTFCDIMMPCNAIRCIRLQYPGEKWKLHFMLLLLTVSLHTANAPQRYATEFTFWVDISFILLDSCDKKK